MSSPQIHAKRRSQLQSGAVVRDTYTVLNFLGSGRFGDTYRVRHRYMGIQAMKVLVDGLDETERDACFTEAFLLSKLSYSGIVRVFDANHLSASAGGFPYITMEYVGGGTLEHLLDEAENGLILDVALEVGQQVAKALSHAHRLEPPLVHRDVKPANILLEEVRDLSPVVRLADYGLAVHANLFTRTVQAGGTILYMSPESLRGFETAASDVFSLGLVIYELLAGTLPYPKQAFGGLEGPKEAQKTLAQLHSQPIEPPSYFDPKIPSDVDTVVLRALAIDEVNRFQTGDDFAQALAACQAALRHNADADLAGEAKSELRSIFSCARRVDGLATACQRLDQLIEEHSSLAPAYQEHFTWMLNERNRLSHISESKPDA